PATDVLETVKAELNVKEIRFLEDAEELVTLEAVPNFKALGPRFGASTQAAAAAIRALDTTALRASRRGEPVSITLDGERFELDPGEFQVQEVSQGGLVVESDEGYTVALDPTISPQLR